MLTLIKFSEQHRVTLLSHFSDPTITAALPGYTDQDIDIWVNHILNDPNSYVIELDGHMIGAARLEQNPHSDFSYWLHADHRGKGYATQINNKLCRMAISLGWKTISGTCDPYNYNSQKVLIRCGFKANGTYWTKLL